MLVARAQQYPERTAIGAAEGTFTYRDLLDASARVAGGLLRGEDDLGETRVAFLVSPGFGHVATQWGIWRAGGVAVPLATSHPPPELDYVIRDSDAGVVVADAELAPRLEALRVPAAVRRLTTTEALAADGGSALPEVGEGRRAMILYTSGTTGRPKGVVTTHANLCAQVRSLVAAWEWSADDRILLVLPLRNAVAVASGRRQYSRNTPDPRTSSSPGVPGATGVPSASTSRTSTPGSGVPTNPGRRSPRSGFESAMANSVIP